MKNIVYTVIGLLVFAVSCTEVGPSIDLINENTGGISNGEVRRVLVEEFTGVRCVNCPEGTKKIEDLRAIHGSKLIPVAIHAGFFAEPYPESKYDFKTPESIAIEANLLGPVSGYPSSSIDRRIYPNEFEIPVSLSKWAGYVSQEINQAPKLTIDVTTTFDTSNRTLGIEASLDFLETVTDPLGISVMITEDSISDAQLTPSGLDTTYMHRHVLRTMLTNYRGQNLEATLTTKGASPQFTYNYTLPPNWKAKQCHVVVFVSKKSSTLDVLQVNEAKVLE